ncbi:sigma-70 family RNA polymerase sigma factor [Streptomyces sp. OF3]|uniref:Sigma-70 family RNA polymerase sigma factor n=1 Tax=Streptomyces alkaliterrae TaxID=2213162 RepID=A0A7W3ZKL5_9ACTN|nr:sigma-70 family RNA polymerase sigma factor [Streptomyces alkaliterrae]MBB1251803.1 sigma-70 family RNA polymerase sigma factor [Streptomyces alkaliterrae]
MPVRVAGTTDERAAPPERRTPKRGPRSAAGPSAGPGAERAAERKQAFRELVGAQLPRLYWAARALVGDDAEDAVQDCMVKAFERFDQLHDPVAGPAWLRRILINCCRDRLRADARHPDSVGFEEVESFSLYRKIAYEDPFPYSDSLHLDFLQEFGREDVHAVLRRLPDLYRVPLVLVHMEGFLARETAEILQVPLGTVLARLHRGRKLFEKRMWDYAEENGLLKGGSR